MRKPLTTKFGRFQRTGKIAEIVSTSQLARLVADAALSGNIKQLEKIVADLSPDHRAIYQKHFGEAPKAENFADEETLYNATFEATVTALGEVIKELSAQHQADGARHLAGGAR